MSKRRGRKIRRQAKAVLRHGPSAKRKHTSKGGRTGSVHQSKLKSRILALKEDHDA